MTTLRRFTPATKFSVIHIQESIRPDEVIIEIEEGTHSCSATMTKAQFRELCRLGVPSPYDQDTVRFQPPTE